MISVVRNETLISIPFKIKKADLNHCSIINKILIYRFLNFNSKELNIQKYGLS